MTKELVKSENGHKNHKTRNARSQSGTLFFYSSRIKMKSSTAWLIVLFVAVVSGETTSSEEKSVTKSEEITEANLPISNSTETLGKSNNNTAQPVTDDGSKNIPNEKLRKDDEIDLVIAKDMAVYELNLKKVIDAEDEIMQELNQDNSYHDSVENNSKTDDVDNSPENPTESKISKDFIDIRRHESSSNVNQESSRPVIQFDDTKTEAKVIPKQRNGQRSRKFRPKLQDSAPLLQLTQGGYERPYNHPIYRQRYSPNIRADSSEQSGNIQQAAAPDTNSIVPQVTYIPSSQLPFAYEQGSLTNTPFDSTGRNFIALNQIIPPSPQNGFFNSPPPEFASYSNAAFQPRFSPSSNIGGIPNFSNDPNNAGMYQTVSNNRLQTSRNLFQNLPQPQSQPAVLDEGRNVQTQFQQNPVPLYSGYQIMDDISAPNYDSFFRSPDINTQFQVPPNFYENAPNTVNSLSNPPVNLLSQYPSIENRVPLIFQYPNMRSGLQNSQQPTNNQRLISDASQNENKAKVIEQNTDTAVNRDDLISGQIGTRLPTDSIGNVYMRYPTLEAGYAIVENLPVQNYSNESKNGDVRSVEGQTNNLNNTLSSLRTNLQINNSLIFPPELFRSIPIEFRNQNPPGGIFAQLPDRNRAIPNYSSRDFEPRIRLNPLVSLPESFLNVNNQQQLLQESNVTPACAKETNASICFEDNEYPRSDILYTISSNSFLTDRLLNPDLSLDSLAFVERNGNVTEQKEENYACDVATKYGTPLRAKNLAGLWRIVVNVQGRFSQPLRMEVCKTLGSSCSYTDSSIKTTCVQKFSIQRLLTWSPSRGIYSDVYKIPVACSCQITQPVEN